MNRRDALGVRPDELDTLDNALCGVDGWSHRGDAPSLGWTRDGQCHMDWPRKQGLAGQALSLLPGGCQAAYSKVQFLGIVKSGSVAISILQKEKSVNLQIHAERIPVRRRRCKIGWCRAGT
jgi:hypothetical protein